MCRLFYYNDTSRHKRVRSTYLDFFGEQIRPRTKHLYDVAYNHRVVAIALEYHQTRDQASSHQNVLGYNLESDLASLIVKLLRVV